MMMSAPAPDWIAEVMRDCRSLALTVSTLSVIPSAFLRDRPLEQHVGGRHEIGPAQPVDAGLLGERRRTAAGQDGGHAARCRQSENSTPRNASHGFLLSFFMNG